MSGTLWVVALWSIAIIAAALSFLAWARLARPPKLEGAVEEDEPEHPDEAEDGDEDASEEVDGT